jgi:spore maturation protein SpmA
MPPYPLCDDPCRLLTHYPTQVLSQEQVLGLGSMATPEGLKTLSDVWITNFGADKRSPTATIEQVLAAIAQEGPLTVKEIVHRYAGLEPGARVYLCRTLVYLVKFDILRSLFDSIQ